MKSITIYNGMNIPCQWQEHSTFLYSETRKIKTGKAFSYIFIYFPQVRKILSDAILQLQEDLKMILNAIFCFPNIGKVLPKSIFRFPKAGKAISEYIFCFPCVGKVLPKSIFCFPNLRKVLLRPVFYIPKEMTIEKINNIICNINFLINKLN